MYPLGVSVLDGMAHQDGPHRLDLFQCALVTGQALGEAVEGRHLGMGLDRIHSPAAPGCRVG